MPKGVEEGRKVEDGNENSSSREERRDAAESGVDSGAWRDPQLNAASDARVRRQSERGRCGDRLKWSDRCHGVG